MLRNRFLWPMVGLLTLAFATSLLARGQTWAFLGHTQVEANQDHSRVQITRRDRLFRAVQLRVSDVIFFDRIVVHFSNGTSRELAVNERISPEGRNYVIDLLGERRPLESVELWYYKEPWGHNPSVSLYGIPLGYTDGEDTPQEY
jgi:hypothetical protein